MRIRFCVITTGLILSITAFAQTAPQSPPINPSTPASRVGDGAQTKAGTPVPPSPTTAVPGGGVAGSATSSTAQRQESQASSEGLTAMTDSDLASQIQNALSKEPTLTGDSPHVTVSGDTIELAGVVGTNKEKVTATRIVQSYATNKKLVNKLTVGKK
jgi:BON domain